MNLLGPEMRVIHVSLSNLLSGLDFLFGSLGHGTAGTQRLFVRRHQHGLVGRQEQILLELGESVVTVGSTIGEANRLWRRYEHRALTGIHTKQGWTTSNQGEMPRHIC